MIISVKELMEMPEFNGQSEKTLQRKLNAIEDLVRAYTNNNFQNSNVRFVSSASGDKLMGTSAFIRKGDTIQISQSMVNDGLYVVKEVTEDSLTVNRELFDCHSNMVTKIEYPQDVIQCALDLFEWKKNFGAKIGIKSESETLSRHSESVTYEDSATLFMGYPVGILKGLSLHKKARC